MKQQIFASYGPSSYPNKMDSHSPFHSAPGCPTTSDHHHHQHTFNESSFFNTAPQEIFSVPVSRGAEGSLETWLMHMPASTSPESSRVSMSPSQGIATPPSDGFYSPPYPEQLPLYTYELPEQLQLQPLRTESTSHPDWMDSAETWQRNYPGGNVWATHPFVAQTWTPNSYDGSAIPSMTSSHAHTSNATLNPFMYPARDHFPTSDVVQTTSAVAVDEVSLRDEQLQDEELQDEGLQDEEDFQDDDDTSDDEETDWNDEVSNYSQTGDSPSVSRSRSNTRSSRIQVDRWTVPVNCIQQSEIRGYKCHLPNCYTSFQRPEHLRRHVRSKHSSVRPYVCAIPGCHKPFSRGDNLGDHYWTHLERGGRAGVNKKMTLQEIKLILGPKGKKIIRKLREKLNKHNEKERQKQLLTARMAYRERSML